MAVKTPISIEGNLTEDPHLTQTSQGTPVARFSVAVNDRQYDEESGQWRDVGEPVYHRTSVFGRQAENVAASLKKGDGVVVNGDLQFDTWEDDEGRKRTGTQIAARSIGPSLRYNTVEVNRRNPKPSGPEAKVTGPILTERRADETGPVASPQQTSSASWSR